MTSSEEAEGVSMNTRSSYACEETAMQGVVVVQPRMTCVPLSSVAL